MSLTSDILFADSQLSIIFLNENARSLTGDLNLNFFEPIFSFSFSNGASD
jgi:hypothetical protein